MDAGIDMVLQHGVLVHRVLERIARRSPSQKLRVFMLNLIISSTRNARFSFGDNRNMVICEPLASGEFKARGMGGRKICFAHDVE